MQQSLITCAHCGTPKTISGSACSVCGSLENKSVTIGIVGNTGCAKAGNIGTVAEERDALGEQFRMRVQTSTGARSNELLANDVLTLNIHGPVQIGRKGEPRAIDTLLCRLRQNGRQYDIETGLDHHGEDGILIFQNERLTLQVVTVPRDQKLWKDANHGSATTSVPVAIAAEWVRDAVVAKFKNTPPSELAKTVLVLDAGLAGILSAHEVMDAYLELYGDPQPEFKFASIWLVGPTPSTTTRIGTGCI